MRLECSDTQACPCGQGLVFGDCCKPFLFGTSRAATAKQLMQSRYTAYVLHDREYLLASWHPTTRPNPRELEFGTNWQGLTVQRCDAGTPFDTEGIVEFSAHFLDDAHHGVHHEVSRFKREGGQWFYVDELR